MNHCSHPYILFENMEIPFSDVADLHISIWVPNGPFPSEPANVEAELRDQFINLQNDD